MHTRHRVSVRLCIVGMGEVVVGLGLSIVIHMEVVEVVVSVVAFVGITIIKVRILAVVIVVLLSVILQQINTIYTIIWHILIVI